MGYCYRRNGRMLAFFRSYEGSTLRLIVAVNLDRLAYIEPIQSGLRLVFGGERFTLQFPKDDVVAWMEQSLLDEMGRVDEYEHYTIHMPSHALFEGDDGGNDATGE